MPEEIFQTESCDELLDDFEDEEIDCSQGPTYSRNYNTIIFFANVLN